MDDLTGPVSWSVSRAARVRKAKLCAESACPGWTRLEANHPALVLTGEAACGIVTKVIMAPVAFKVNRRFSQVTVERASGMEHHSDLDPAMR